MSKTDLTPSCPICNGKIFRNLWAVQGLFWRDISERALERESISFELGQCQVCAHIMILDEYTPQILKRLYS
ncbi:MAG: hypothetical protein ABID54_03600, partial [Pseudomonadota bacterium]